MDMEGLGTEEFVGSSSNNVNDATHMIAKGKRTKRLRLLSPCGVSAAAAAATVMTSSSSSANSGDHVSGGGGGDYGSFSSTTTTTTYESTDQEEEDMANCLILLAQGGGGGGGGDAHRHKKQAEDHDDHDRVHDGSNTSKIEKGNGNTSSSRRFAEMATATATAARIGFYVYECKTCNRTFPSFQALGGHRASHKKPKMTAVEEKKPPLIPASLPPPPPQLPPPPPQPQQPQPMTANYDPFEEEAGQAHVKSGPAISLQLGSSHRAFHGNNKAKIHECSICGSEFTSGQALGGHMRRHRASSTNTASTHHQLMAMGGINETSCNTTAMATAAAAAEEELEEVQPRRNILQLDLNLPAPEDDLRESKFQFTAATQKSMVLSAAPALVGCHY